MSEIHDERVRELAKVRLANDMTFHRGVGEASGNTFMMKLWPVLETEMTPVLAVEQEQRHDDSRACALHESLVECIRRGDRDEIYENLRMHVVDSAEESLETFDAEPTVEK